MKFMVCVAFAYFLLVLCSSFAFAEGDPLQTAERSAPTLNSTVGFIYVSSTVSSGNEITAFSVGANGVLSPIKGSPYAEDGQSLAVNTKYLFASDGTNISSYSIATNGALKIASSINAQQFGGDCYATGALSLDLTGTTLYDLENCDNNDYRSFGVDESTGALNYVGDSDGSVEYVEPLSFIANNLYGYTANCAKYTTVISGFSRNLDGTLTRLNINPPIPLAPTGEYYCPFHTAADSANDVAIALQPGVEFGPVPGPTQFAVYTVDDAGNLTTNSTLSNMPSTQVGYVTEIKTSPSRNVLAVSGTLGLQLFQFHGGNPLSRLTGLLLKKQIDQIAWDSHNHLFAISNSAGLLYVLTITPTAVRQAPGSPHTISNPQALAVFTKP